MDELNKRVLTVMEVKQLSKSSFAALLDVSLPILTHVSTGRNKPGLDMIQKLLSKFPDINPDWLILGVQPMYREGVKKVELHEEMARITQIANSLPKLSINAKQVEDYHALLLKEILYLNELLPYLREIQDKSGKLSLELSKVQEEIKIKLED